MAADEAHQGIELVKICISNCSKEVVEEKVVEFELSDSFIDGYLSSSIVLFVLDTFGSMRSTGIARLSTIALYMVLSFTLRTYFEEQGKQRVTNP